MIEILDVDCDRLAGRRMQFGGIELMILDRDRQRDGIVGARAAPPPAAPAVASNASDGKQPPADAAWSCAKRFIAWHKRPFASDRECDSCKELGNEASFLSIKKPNIRIVIIRRGCY